MPVALMEAFEKRFDLIVIEVMALPECSPVCSAGGRWNAQAEHGRPRTGSR